MPSEARSTTYDIIGSGYDSTRRADARVVARLVHHLAPEAGGRYLDLACGTGNYTVALAEHGLDIVGVDASTVMLEAARAKAPALDWRLARAEALPFADASFDGALCTVAIHHFDDLRSAFAEAGRVLRAGCFVVFTATPEQMQGYWLNRYFPQAIVRSMADMPALEAIEDALRAAGFGAVASEPFDVPDDLADLFLYAAKHRPALYLDVSVRAGISTFARRLCDPEELAHGLAALEADIASGAIDEIIASFAHDRGDYLFVIADKGPRSP